jgi:transposase InsO family protein
VPALNTKYVGDITYLSVGSGKFCYLATVIDLASRRLAGWAIAGHMRAELVIDALAAAERTRGSLAGAILHTDHGSQAGLNWSSQQLDHGNVDGQASGLDDGADRQVADEVAGQAVVAARPGAVVLA